MKPEPACVRRIALSLKFRRSCTSGASAEPKVAVAIRHCGVGAEVEVLVGVLVDVVETVEVVVAVLAGVLVVVLVAAAVICIAKLV